jgi:hypothetical protein
MTHYQSQLFGQAKRLLDRLIAEARRSDGGKIDRDCSYLGQAMALFEMADRSGGVSRRANSEFLRNAIKRVEAAQ